MRFRPLVAAVLALCLIVVTACGGDATAKTRAGLTYEEILNTGLANDCFTVDESARGAIPLDPEASYQFASVCMHPSSVQVLVEPVNKRQEARFVDWKILTRYTSSLDDVFGDLTVADGQITFAEKGGMDFQLITVIMPGGEEVPFVFSSKDLVATAPGDTITTSTDFEGPYTVPSYRTSNFLDPKGRGLTTGYDSAVGLVPVGTSEELERGKNVKRYLESEGKLNLSITRVDGETGEFSGLFTALQKSDTDMGSKEPLELKITGELYGRVDKA